MCGCWLTWPVNLSMKRSRSSGFPCHWMVVGKGERFRGVSLLHTFPKSRSVRCFALARKSDVSANFMAMSSSVNSEQRSWLQPGSNVLSNGDFGNSKCTLLDGRQKEERLDLVLGFVAGNLAFNDWCRSPMSSISLRQKPSNSGALFVASLLVILWFS